MPYDDRADQLTVSPNHQYTTGSLYQQKDTCDSVQKTYVYTSANLLESVTHDEVQGTPVSSMTWDADSNRVSFSSSTGGTWRFVYDPTAGIPAVIVEVTPSGSVYYIREPNGALIARVSGNDIHYYHFDALGSTRLLTDDSGAVTDEYSYDAWGNVSHDTGSTAQPYQFVGQLGYYTHWQDPNLDLLQLGVRFYDPESGRFTQVDPIRDGLNFHAYGENRPVVETDPTGLSIRHKYCVAKFRVCLGARYKIALGIYGACVVGCHVAHGLTFLPEMPAELPPVATDPVTDMVRMMNWSDECITNQFRNPGMNEVADCHRQDRLDKCIADCEKKLDSRLVKARDLPPVLVPLTL